MIFTTERRIKPERRPRLGDFLAGALFLSSVFVIGEKCSKTDLGFPQTSYAQEYHINTSRKIKGYLGIKRVRNPDIQLNDFQNDPEYCLLRDYFVSNLGKYSPARADPEKRFTVLEPEHWAYLKKIEKETRPRLALLAGLLNFNEMSGRETDNPYGITPPGMYLHFRNLEEATDYLVSEKALGGGYDNRLNILYEIDENGNKILKKGEITPEEITEMLKHYTEGKYPRRFVRKYREIVESSKKAVKKDIAEFVSTAKLPEFLSCN